MGTINYKTSDYITMGINCDNNDYEDLDVWQFEIDDLLEIVQDKIKAADISYYHVIAEYGYYEGFSVQIENNYGIAYDDYTDKAWAQKDVTKIKKLLLSFVDLGLVACFPGWGTTYYNEEKTREEIKRAISAMRNEIKNTPTWAQYERGC